MGRGGKLGPSPDPQLPDAAPPPRGLRSRRWKLVLISLLALALLLASAISAILLIGLRSRTSGDSRGRRPTQAISRTCSKARYPDLCVSSLLDFPGSMVASEQDLIHISFNMTLQHFNRALYQSSGMNYLQMEPIARSAYDDCLELLGASVDALSRSLSAVGGSGSPAPAEDIVTWLSAALTNQDTCGEGLADANGGVKDRMAAQLKDLEELVSNCLAIFAASDGGGDFAGVPIENRRRLMDVAGGGGGVPKPDGDGGGGGGGEYPEWLGERERELLDMPAAEVQADIVVAKDGGSGTYKTIAEAIKKAPESSGRRIIIYVRAGRYEEDNLKVGKKKTNLMFIGDGKDKTVITGGKSVADKMTTFHTASFAASGAGFIARDMTFENYAGPEKHQAVALRVGADHGVVYRCSIVGYQDTLYVHSNRQFFRECDIYGTVDFIFGNAAVVIQKSNIYARKPMAKQKNTITAQNRKDPNQNTGISIHACQIVAAPDLEASKGSIPTYLGRPWKMYSRVVYMLSYMGDHIHPEGWLEWNGDFALDTLYYGEYMNDGPGAAVGRRVKWPGFRVITSTTEANKFTVAQFIFGSSWLPSTGVAFVAGLST
ncbi:hypothetical protein ACJRO7_036305 [Eucalyptus globulus]|uniref:Pectinesterase n=1 Tax=Eucalyptus globulus TaxID=34317 RepID=A0ABD3IGS3_EUCGL